MILKHFDNELPSIYADRVGAVYTSKLDKLEKKKKGQYFTPTNIANFMSSFSTVNELPKLNILDPGCGTATLSCSLIENLTKNNSITEINLTCYEIDLELLNKTKIILNYLEKWLSSNFPNVSFNWTLIEKDFVLDNKNLFLQNSLFLNNIMPKKFDLIISNPPYFKIPKSDPRSIIAKSIVHGQPNIYSIFMMLSAKLLSDNGEMIFIVPRSFASGPYFRQFREEFFDTIFLNAVHIFNSRTKAFKRDKVLQENIILKAIKRNSSLDKVVTISTSESMEDLDNKIDTEYNIDDLIDYNSKQKILFLPQSKVDYSIMKKFKTWSNNLEKNFIRISTGPVVAFRKKDYLFHHKIDDKILLSLLWLTNTKPMQLVYPGTRNKKQYIQDCKETRKVLLENKNYVLLRRFSTKDDKSRLIATPYFSDRFPQSKIGIENHLNYIYRYKGELNKNEVMGISALFNSTLFDQYFRTFNGNTQVSATELKEIPLPSMDKIEALGFEIMTSKNIDQDHIDRSVNKIIQ